MFKSGKRDNKRNIWNVSAKCCEEGNTRIRELGRDRDADLCSVIREVPLENLTRDLNEIREWASRVSTSNKLQAQESNRCKGPGAGANIEW